MADKMLVTQALDERDLLVKKIQDKISKASFVDTIKPNEEKVLDARVSKEEFAKDAESAYQQIQDLIDRFQRIDAAIVASNANEILLFNNVFSISYEIRSLSKNGTLDSYVRTYDNKGPRLSFIHILDKAKMVLFNISEETLYRKYFLYLSRHPEVKKQLEESMTSISEEERKAFYKLLKDRK